MAYFTWREAGLTADCASLDSMAARFEEAAALMRRMAAEGFRLEKDSQGQRITHPYPKVHRMNSDHAWLILSLSARSSLKSRSSK